MFVSVVAYGQAILLLIAILRVLSHSCLWGTFEQDVDWFFPCGHEPAVGRRHQQKLIVDQVFAKTNSGWEDKFIS